jgi:hypothetical protein
MEANLAHLVNLQINHSKDYYPSGDLSVGLDSALSFGFAAFMDFYQNPILQKRSYTT